MCTVRLKEGNTPSVRDHCKALPLWNPERVSRAIKRHTKEDTMVVSRTTLVAIATAGIRLMVMAWARGKMGGLTE